MRAQRGDRRTTTNTFGKVALALERDRPTVIVAERSGDIMRTAQAALASDTAPNVAILMSPGKTNIENKAHLYGLRMRAAYLDHKAIILSHTDIGDDNMNPQDALFASTVLRQKELRLGKVACVLVDGDPQPKLRLSETKTRGVEFVEMYGADADCTGILDARWRGSCSGTDLPPVIGPSGIHFAGVWMRK